MTVPKVFLSGYAKLPDNTTAQKLYNHLVLVVTQSPPRGPSWMPTALWPPSWGDGSSGSFWWATR